LDTGSFLLFVDYCLPLVFGCGAGKGAARTEFSLLCVHQIFDFSLGARFPFVNPSSLGAAVLRLLQVDAGLFLSYWIKS
jgi:hypothetical protein